MLESLAISEPDSQSAGSASRLRKWLVCLGLAVAVSLAYSGIVHCGFVDYDDGDYITNNPPIRHGLNWTSITWAFTTGWAANWHPLTWMSHMIDYSLFGTDPAGYHVGNVAFHLANAILLFLWLEYATGAFWRSAAVAAFFALHPFHVESVAWASERKDVLSTLFWIISVWLYCVYFRRVETKTFPRIWLFYGGSLFVFALGLMSKPMLVTLPCVLLLLDYWPLRRTTGLSRRVLEKVPFFLLSAAASVATMIAQKKGGAVQSLVKYTLKLRLENTPIAYVRYLQKTFWPSRLNIFYLYPLAWPGWMVWGSLFALILITVLAFQRRRQQPYLIIGWLWFIGMLVPAIGLIQAGEQSMADRYSYLPIVGIFIMVAWTLSDLAIGRGWIRSASSWLAGGALVVCSILTHAQAGYWRDTGSLFGHAIDVSPHNYLAYYNLGCYLAKLRDPTNAATYFERCLQSNPKYPRAFNNLAFIQIDEGQFDQAIANLRQAVALRSQYPEAWLNLGRAYAAKGEAAMATQSFATALQIKPDLTEAHFRLGELLLAQRDFAGAIPQLEAAIAALPRQASYHLKLADAWLGSGKIPNAVNEFEITLKLDPDIAEACNNLAWIMATSPDAGLRDGALAVALARHAVELSAGKSPLLLGTLAAAWAEARNFEQAVRAADQARQLAVAQTNEALAASLAAQISLYRSQQPFRDGGIK